MENGEWEMGKGKWGRANEEGQMGKGNREGLMGNGKWKKGYRVGEMGKGNRSLKLFSK